MEADIQTVADKAGVSISTVSRTFTRPDLVSAKTRKKVMEIAENLDFSVSRSAASLKSGQSFRVALLTNDGIPTWFNSHIFAGLDSVLHPAGYDISVFILANIKERQAFFENLPVRRNVDAVVVNSFDIDPSEVSRLGSMHVPVIGISVPSNKGFDATVSIDDRKAMHIAVNHLAALGHKVIGYVGETANGSHMHYSTDSRLQGFQEACKDHPDVIPQVMLFNHDENLIDAAINGILTADPAPTAVCFVKDEVALPVLYRIRRFGREIPRDLSIIGFDDVNLSKQTGLTTLHQDPYLLGATAARKTLDAMNQEKRSTQPGKDTPKGDQPGEIDNSYITFPIQLMLRDTTATPRTR
ncbi:LacI family DNA-binding transcriptional regulator [Bifidobacterium sp. ESL0769]|uniref:LacI family DNA-binding transcriptional regulator n=1 Tax=Bifidobacterium sp. ESL0769 TaxID=2983229 RepID=UPI0023F90F2E|nr:LacI family DNA-binding transcriptional regulator [Bifidobacterium sp. ESL0769]WEV67313.1 LacI family DNA-binding transcriptional regulator [Bifidobacterium sp. ESL0769]